MEIRNHYIDGDRIKKIVTEANIEYIKKPDINSHNSVEEVLLNGIRGFLKKSVDGNGKSIPTLDKYEYLVSKMSELYGLKTAQEFLVYDQDGVSLFSKSVVSGNEKLIMASGLTFELLRQLKIPEEMIQELKEKGVSAINDLIIKYNLSQETVKSLKELSDKVTDYNKGIQKFREGLERKEDGPNVDRFYVKDHDQMEFAIYIFINKLDMLNLDNKEEIVRDYIRMCYFDALIGNKDRNPNNYGLVRKEDGSYTFAPLFDSATISMPTTDDNLWQINEYLIDREATLKYLEAKYPNYVNDLKNLDVSEIMTTMSLDVLDKEEFEKFNKLVLNNLSRKPSKDQAMDK